MSELQETIDDSGNEESSNRVMHESAKTAVTAMCSDLTALVSKEPTDDWVPTKLVWKWNNRSPTRWDLQVEATVTEHLPGIRGIIGRTLTDLRTEHTRTSFQNENIRNWNLELLIYDAMKLIRGKEGNTAGLPTATEVMKIFDAHWLKDLCLRRGDEIPVLNADDESPRVSLAGLIGSLRGSAARASSSRGRVEQRTSTQRERGDTTGPAATYNTASSHAGNSGSLNSYNPTQTTQAPLPSFTAPSSLPGSNMSCADPRRARCSGYMNA